MEAIRRNQTMESAVQELRRHPEARPELVDFVGLMQTGTASRRSALLRRTKASVQKLTAARDNLNQMIFEGKRKKDLEEAKCSEFEDAQSKLVEATKQDVALFQGEATRARGRVVSAQKAIELLEAGIPALKDRLVEQQTKCSEDSFALKKQLKIVADDITHMSKVLDGTSCAAAVALLQCSGRGTSFITFGHHVMRRKFSKLQSPIVREIVQQGLTKAYASARPAPALSFLQEDEEDPVIKTSDQPTSARKQHNKCTLRNSPSCEGIRDRFMQIQSEVEDKQMELTQQWSSLQARCKYIDENFQAQIQSQEIQLKQAQAEVAGATTAQNNAEESMRLKNSEVDTLLRETGKTMKTCHKNMDQFSNEICALQKIRGELNKMDNGNTVYQDCEQSAWVAGACSADCGGGEREFTRSVLVQPSNGAQCLPQLMKRKCNEQPCPVDCEVEEWTGWSQCTAECGGGVRERIRSVLQDAQHGGQPCGETTEVQSCNIDACDQDCELADWTEWSSCSKACSGGLQKRVRHIDRPVSGQGTCQDEHSEQRVHYKPCNLQNCELPPNSDTVICDAKIDVVLVLDGSDSVGSAGWDKVKLMAKSFVTAFNGGEEKAMVAVLTFSGPKSLQGAKKCTANLGQVVDMAQDCGITWTSHFTTDTASISGSLDGVNFPGGSTLTSSALSAVENELQGGRPDANSVVIIVTDSKPLSPFRTSNAVHNLRKKARLLWVPVSQFAPLSLITDWASHPKSENVVKVGDWDTLAQPDTVSNIIANVCPVILR